MRRIEKVIAKIEGEQGKDEAQWPETCTQDIATNAELMSLPDTVTLSVSIGNASRGKRSNASRA